MRENLRSSTEPRRRAVYEIVICACLIIECYKSGEPRMVAQKPREGTRWVRYNRSVEEVKRSCGKVREVKNERKTGFPLHWLQACSFLSCLFRVVILSPILDTPHHHTEKGFLPIAMHSLILVISCPAHEYLGPCLLLVIGFMHILVSKKGGKKKKKKDPASLKQGSTTYGSRARSTEPLVLVRGAGELWLCLHLWFCPCQSQSRKDLC